MIADAYYEWRQTDRQPFAVALGNRGPMTFAGLWDSWRAPDGATIKSFAIITTRANALLAAIHDRMPVMLASDAGRLGSAKATRPTKTSRPCSGPIRPSA